MFVLYRTEYDKYSEDPEFKPASRHAKDLFEEVKMLHYIEVFLSEQVDLQRQAMARIALQVCFLELSPPGGLHERGR